MGGRIADIAIHPSRPSTWYLAVGSGGVWKTTNAGTTWKPIFDAQPSFSIGCVSIDPQQPDVVWVGTGEAVSGRHVAWGDGVYRSRNGGASWEHMGLPDSEHIAEILIDPRDSNVVFVAAIGPLWSSGGERGLFKTVDGGHSWTSVIDVDADTGVTSVVVAPNNPDVMYAATHQRRRTVWSYLGGGPGSGVHKSTDGGTTWRRITEGLPKHEMGKIGLAVTPADPNLVFATIEANEAERGFYRSTDQGESWERRSSYISGGTGPHYYQEIFASPTDPQRVYQVDVFVHVTRDGGKSFAPAETGRQKHSDNHTIWFDPHNSDHLLVGTDAGLYETFDDMASFRHFGNLPISQFYRVAVDNSLPFYNVLAGAQDLGTLFGPSRTMHVDGVRNQDWRVALGADGYHVAFDPDDPQTSYLEWQEGNLMRHDTRTMELVDIQPQPAEGDPAERWNWDTPILVSPHNSHRIYTASQRVWRSDDRGDSWTPISGDLTTDANRYELPTGGRVHSVDALWDHMAMSKYATVTHLTESPVVADTLYCGSDDGQVHVSTDGGQQWNKVAAMPGLPAGAFINDVEADQHNGASVFVAADDHKNGNYAPFIFESSDHGATWRPIAGDLPDGAIVWAIEQDHIDPNLLFAATERGVFVSLNRGGQWHRMGAGMPTIAVRDVKVQRRDNDLVAATFGRGIYVLDDYSALRALNPTGDVDGAAALFAARDAWWYVPYQPMQAPNQPTLGSTAFRQPNPAFGAMFTYVVSADLAAELEPSNKQRNRSEADAAPDRDIAFPGYDTLWAEHIETPEALVLLVSDADGRPVRRLTADASAGLHRLTWDLRLAAPQPVDLSEPAFKAPWDADPKGALVAPGHYRAVLVRQGPAGSTELTGAQTFAVTATPATSDRSDPQDSAAFQAHTSNLARKITGAAAHVSTLRDRIRHLNAALSATAGADDTLFARLHDLRSRLESLAVDLTGHLVRSKLSEPEEPSAKSLVDRVMGHHWDSTANPTTTQRTAIERAAHMYGHVAELLVALVAELDALTLDIDATGGVWTPR
jgi:photosystem II stability/assembly factor-like uncharacterized protein